MWTCVLYHLFLCSDEEHLSVQITYICVPFTAGLDLGGSLEILLIDFLSVFMYVSLCEHVLTYIDSIQRSRIARLNGRCTFNILRKSTRSILGFEFLHSSPLFNVTHFQG